MPNTNWKWNDKKLNDKKSRRVKFKIEMAEKEAELFERYGSEAGSSHGLEDK